MLRTDPDGSYVRMDGATRDSYRHAIARLARRNKVDETGVAREALALAGTHRAPGEGGLDARTRHVGHYLVGAGHAALAARLRAGGGVRSRLAALLETTPVATRIGASALLT